MIIIKLLILLLFTSCSFKSVVIPNATYFVADHVGDKYDLYYSQEKEFKEGLDLLLKSRIDLFKKFNSHLKSINIVNYNLEKNLFHYSKIYSALALGINKILAKPFSEFKDKQVKSFFKILEDENETILNRSRKDKTNEIKKRFEFFFGKLNKNQVQLIKNNIRLFQSINKKRFQNRLITQVQLKKILIPNRNIISSKTSIQQVFDQNLDQREPIKNMKPIAIFLTSFFKSLKKSQVKKFQDRQKTITQWMDAAIVHFKTLKA